MPTTIVNKYIRQLEVIKKRLPDQARKILIENRDEIIKILREDQLNEGLNSKGNIAGRYSKATEEYAKDPFNKPREPKIAGQPYNFDWTGGTVENLFMFFQDKESFSLSSLDSKALFINKKFGGIFDLTEKNNEIINNKILYPKLLEWAFSQIKI